MSLEKSYSSDLLNEADELGLTVPGYHPYAFEDPMEVQIWAGTVRRRITLFTAGKIDKYGDLIED